MSEVRRPAVGDAGYLVADDRRAEPRDDAPAWTPEVRDMHLARIAREVHARVQHLAPSN